ncbi:MAG: ArgP/LysG family DNA-binding transcriptional regulator [Burkholderiales bacterium PBB5]|nr:MAG: ArgP/LysG family DNA-binding transcriptional regulator [Burkholderiales bacterium PBB5]
MPLDSAQLAALHAVVHEGSFERAAQHLHISRSAVSQRVKLLESRVGQVLVKRGAPCTATPAGQTLVRHAQQMALHEADALAQLRGGALVQATLSVAVNADSLATWFIAAMAPLAREQGLAFDLVVEDQDHSAALLREGRVLAAVTADPQPVQGCRVQRLGTMRYRALASPDFVRRHFPEGVTPQALGQAPMLVYDRQDALQHRFVRRFTRRKLSPPVHWLPSTQGFVDATVAGIGWGMSPQALAQPALAAGRLVDLAPDRPLDVVLYWQHWRLEVAPLALLTRQVQLAFAAVQPDVATTPATTP